MCVYIYIYIHTYLCIYIYIYIYTHIIIIIINLIIGIDICTWFARPRLWKFGRGDDALGSPSLVDQYSILYHMSHILLCNI